MTPTQHAYLSAVGTIWRALDTDPTATPAQRAEGCQSVATIVRQAQLSGLTLPDVADAMGVSPVALTSALSSS